jgi:lipooligosaccharide transport system permease protein
LASYLSTVLTPRWYAVWKRNFLVWRKLLGPAMLGNFGEPVLYILFLGYGLGSFVGQVQGMDYVTFLASGIVCSSAMNTATFEGLYSAYTRMAIQDTWAGMLVAPLQVEDIVLGEVIWAGSKSLISSAAIFLVAVALGAVQGWPGILVLPVMFIVGICFGALALVITSFSSSYDFFLYYFTLVITPMFLVSGVFFPLHAMPEIVQWGAQILPLTHAVSITRPLLTNGNVTNVTIHAGVLLIYAIIALRASTFLIRRRLMV